MIQKTTLIFTIITFNYLVYTSNEQILLTPAQSSATLAADQNTISTTISNLSALYSQFMANYNGLRSYAFSSSNRYKNAIANCSDAFLNNTAIDLFLSSNGNNTTSLTITLQSNISGFNNQVNAAFGAAQTALNTAQCMSNAAQNISLKPSSEKNLGDPRAGAAILVTQAQEMVTMLQQIANSGNDLYNNLPANSTDQTQLVNLIGNIIPNLNTLNSLLNNIEHSSQFSDWANLQSNQLIKTAQTIFKTYANATGGIPMNGYTNNTVNTLKNVASSNLDSAIISLNNLNLALTQAINNTSVTNCYYCMPNNSASYTISLLSNAKGLIQLMLKALQSYQQQYGIN